MEQKAVSGATGFARGFFHGVVQEDLIFPYPELAPGEAEELDLVLTAFRRFAEDKIDPVAIDAASKLPPEVIRGLADMGVLGLTIPDEHGGLGMSVTAYCRFMEAVAGHCGATATLIGGHQSLGSKAIMLFGSEELKARYLPRLATGELIAAFSLSESGAGSDAGALRTVAAWDEQEGVYVLNGTKQWCTNGGVCDVVIIFARTPDLGPVKKGRDITAFVVEMDTPGVTRGREEHKMGLRGSSTTDLGLQNAKVPAANVLGKKGEGLKLALTVLDTGRLSLGACCVGAAKRMLAAAAAHASERQQFDTYLKDFELIQEKLADMAATIYAMESVTYLTAGLADRKAADYAIESAITKTFCSEGLWKVVNHAVQVNGGNGFITEYPYERFLRDSRVNMIFEGTNEIQRLFIAGTGLKAAVAMGGAAGAAPGGGFTRVPAASAAEAAMVETGVKELAAAAAAAVARHGAKLGDRELVLARLADCAIDLYATSACLARTTAAIAARGEEGAAAEIDKTRLFAAAAGRRLELALRACVANEDDIVRRVSERACVAS
jgi:acyl-CoA dehydrogenase family protein 9